MSQSVEDILWVADLAERSGVHSVWVADHFMADGGFFGHELSPYHESTAMIAAISAVTRRVRIGSLVLSATYRHPAAVANWAATVDHLSGGRLTLGIGAGWQTNEHQQYGIPLGAPGERVDRLVEYVQVLRGLWEIERFSFDGSFFQLHDAVSLPKPVQPRVPVLIGGKGPRMLRVAARYADEWNSWATPAEFVERSLLIEQRCARIGRDPGSIWKSTQALVRFFDSRRELDEYRTRVPRPVVGGDSEAILEQLDTYRSAGVDEFIVSDYDLDDGAHREFFERVVTEVSPSLD